MRSTSLTLTFLLLAGTAMAQMTPAKPASATAQSTTAPASTGHTATVQTPTADPDAPAHPITDAQAREMLTATGAIKLKDDLMHQMIAYFHTNMPFLPQDVSDDLEQSFQKIDMETPIIAIYKQHISTEDAASILAFYKTPAGQDLIKALPAITKQSQQIGVTAGRKTAQEVIERHRSELEAAAKQYQQDHAPKPAPSLNTPSGTPSPSAAPSPSTPNAAPAPAGPAAPKPAPTQPQ